MIDTDKYENMRLFLGNNGHYSKLTMLDELLAEVKRLREEIKVLSKYRDIVEKYDDALLADGDTDPRWSELYA